MAGQLAGAQAATAAAIPAAKAGGPDCSRTLTLGLHDHGLLYSAATGAGIDKDFADELARRSGCRINTSLLPRARIWQLIESGALDFSLSGITNEERDKFASFAWYFSNKYYLLVRKDAGILQLPDFESDGTLRLGVIRAFRYSKNANRLVDALNRQQRVTYAASLDPLYKILAANRIQGMIIEPFDYSQVSNKSIRDVTAIIETRDPAIPHGLIMSNKSLPPQERKKWKALVRQMQADGTVLRIFEKYFDPALARSMVNFQA
ncbi:substrate-binding periplasmic protein [Undibacterium sp. TJN25]|uniref:substrate-binding periplasmic protein n=1 Tax=Undibacterium sp. TJN25 TaxID=3413056 RepID=UPI003BF11C6B